MRIHIAALALLLTPGFANAESGALVSPDCRSRVNCFESTSEAAAELERVDPGGEHFIIVLPREVRTRKCNPEPLGRVYILSPFTRILEPC